jgi:hypothetical protein
LVTTTTPTPLSDQLIDIQLEELAPSTWEISLEHKDITPERWNLQPLSEELILTVMPPSLTLSLLLSSDHVEHHPLLQFHLVLKDPNLLEDTHPH